jgi:CIC family chloride channel protein
MPAPFVIVGMMALFGGVAKAPIAVMLMVAEMTNEFSMIVPAMLAITIAYLIMGNTRIYENQVPTRADSPAHRAEFTVPLIQRVAVGQAMAKDVTTCAPDEPVAVAQERMRKRGRRGLPVLDDGKLVGMFTVNDALRLKQPEDSTVAQAMSTKLLVAYPDENLHLALQRMSAAAISRLPVVERDAPDRLIGILSMRDLAGALDFEVNALAAASRGLAELTARAGTLAADVDSVVAVDVPLGSGDAATGKTLAELALPKDAVVTGVFRRGNLLIPRGPLKLERGDRVQVLVVAAEEQAVTECIRGHG